MRLWKKLYKEWRAKDENLKGALSALKGFRRGKIEMKVAIEMISTAFIFLLASKGGFSEHKNPEGPSSVIISVVYDNNEYDPGLKTAWGFSCLIKGTKKTILFDTGRNGRVLLSNMSKLKIDPQEVEVIVLSHIHGDHVGGLNAVLDENSKVTVYLPHSFPDSFKDEVKRYGERINYNYRLCPSRNIKRS